jgi:hypothetical protein
VFISEFPMSKIDALKQFASLREALSKEKSELESRLAEINQALGSVTSYTASAPRASYFTPPRRGVGAGAPGAGRRGNPASLKNMILEATKNKPLSRQEILEAVQNAGYKFVAKEPLNSLGTILYTSKEIKSYGRGIFGPA